MTVDELLPVLASYRQQVEPAWSPATAHKGYTGAVGSPVGQCGVTSAWLQNRLYEDHGIESLYCVGKAKTDTGWVDHCWLEVPGPVHLLTIDLTVDQLRPGEPLMATLYDRWSAGLDYLASLRLSLAEVEADPVQERLTLLVGAMG